VVAGRWQGDAGELAGATGRASGEAVGAELTETAVRRGGSGEVSGQRPQLGTTVADGRVSA
jgi:hypothetical protein